jgi:hypothetical protein
MDGHGDTIYNASQVDLLRLAQQKNTFVARGFQFCQILDGAVFDAMIPIRAFGGSVADVNPDANTFINTIDAKAYAIFQSIAVKFKNGHKGEIKRLACYSAAEGNSAYANLTHQRLLVQLEPHNYFKSVLPSIVPTFDVIPGPRRKYKIAYLLMVHELQGLPHLLRLLELLDDGDGIVLIHVDARDASAALHARLQQWILKRAMTSGQQNVFLAKYRYHNIWGHASLVFTQLSGFWELLDMADWDFVVNLSNYDYPIKRNADIHRILSQEKYRGKNFIEYWPETDDLAERFFRVHLGEEDFSSIYHPQELGLVSWPFPRWRAYKHHQWMIVTPDLIRFLRKDTNALNFLAFQEHCYIPDESFFATGKTLTRCCALE